MDSDEFDADYDSDYAAQHKGLMKKRGQISVGEFFNTLLGRDHRKWFKDFSFFRYCLIE